MVAKLGFTMRGEGSTRRGRVAEGRGSRTVLGLGVGRSVRLTRHL